MALQKPKGRGVKKPKSKGPQAYWAGGTYLVRDTKKPYFVARRPSDGKIAKVPKNASKEQIMRAINQSNVYAPTKLHTYGTEKGYSKTKIKRVKALLK